MARGNDAAAAAAEFRGQYGLMGNAEDLIEANRAAYPADLRSANVTPPDQDYDHDEYADKLQSEVGDGGTVLDSAKHGDNIVAVVETESGRVYKTVLPAHKVGAARKGRRRKGDDDDTRSDEDKAIEAQAAARAEADQIMREAREEAERTIQEAIQKAQEKASEIAQKAAEEAREKQEQAAEDAPDGQERGAGAQRGRASAQDKAGAKEQQNKPSS